MTDELLILLEQQHAHLQSLQIVMKNEELLLGYQRVPPSPFQETTEQKRFLVAAIVPWGDPAATTRITSRNYRAL